jgi:hypothetical protein
MAVKTKCRTDCQRPQNLVHVCGGDHVLEDRRLAGWVVDAGQLADEVSDCCVGLLSVRVDVNRLSDADIDEADADSWADGCAKVYNSHRSSLNLKSLS